MFTFPVGHNKAANAGPNSVSGLIHWVKADAGVTLSGSNVTQWNDQSGHGNNWTVGAGNVTFVSAAQNGLPVIQGGSSAGGVANYLTTTNFITGSSPAEAFIMMKQRQNATTYSWGGFSGESSVVSHYTFGPGSIYESFGNNARQGGFGISSTIYLNYNIINIFGDATTWGINIGNSSIVSQSSSGPTWHAGNFTLFSYHFNQTFNFDGFIGELLIYDHKLTSGDRTTVYNYLKTRWGL